MKCVVYVYCVTPHWLPICEELLRSLGSDECSVVYLNEISKGRARIGWNALDSKRFIKYSADNAQVKGLLEKADNLLCEVRDVNLFETRCKKGLKTFYTSERWFKPFMGIARMLHPRYFINAIRIGRLLNTCDNFMYLPVGIYAAQDMFRLMMISKCRLSYFFRTKKLSFNPMPGGEIEATNKLKMWAYFIKPSLRSVREEDLNNRRLIGNKILWVGRLLRLKRVDDIIRAVIGLNKQGLKFTLDIYGEGPDANRLMELAKGTSCISFYPPVKNDEVRQLMSTNDIYILSSDCHEGWGAVVGEALEEGMLVLGTKDAGASMTQLPKTHLYKAGDVNGLIALLSNKMGLDRTGIREWTPSKAAAWLINEMNKA